MGTVSTVVGGISFWYAQEGTPAPREPLPGDTSVDVCIVGGGYTGLWTAYYLKQAAPFLNITVLRGQVLRLRGLRAGNGGWLYNGIAGRDRYARLHGHEAAVRLQKAMNETVGEVVRAAAAEGIDADAHQGGVLVVAQAPAQLAWLKVFHSAENASGVIDRGLRGARETAERVHVQPGQPALPGRRTAPGCSRSS
ncbi:FAD-dependent oxidoreductase [Streptomyces californicus]